MSTRRIRPYNLKAGDTITTWNIQRTKKIRVKVLSIKDDGNSTSVNTESGLIWCTNRKKDYLYKVTN